MIAAALIPACSKGFLAPTLASQAVCSCSPSAVEFIQVQAPNMWAECDGFLVSLVVICGVPITTIPLPQLIAG